MFNIYQLVSFFRYLVLVKRKADTVFIICSNLSYLPNVSPNADAIASCFTEKFNELNLDRATLKAFFSDGTSVMACS